MVFVDIFRFILPGFFGFHPGFRTVSGAMLGGVFLIFTKHFLDGYEDVKVDIFGGASSQRMFLIMFVMTLHSISEGVGIGVSFGTCTPPPLSRKNRDNYSLPLTSSQSFRWCSRCPAGTIHRSLIGCP